ncbi:MAG: hypothetical protein ABFR75_12285, partial [Acidobacteriota bacterium]
YSFFLKNKFLLLVLLSALIVLIFTGSFIKKRVYKAENALAAGYVLFIMGMSGISLELILIYIFQISFGFIYNSIGLIIAFFMAGLPLGAFLFFKLISLKKNSGKFIAENLSLGIILLMVILTISIPALSGTIIDSGISGELLVLLLIGLSGFLTGGIFPCSVFIINLKKKDPGRVAAVSDALDHLGGAAGALFTGTFFVPLFGIKYTTIILVLFQLSAMITLAGAKIGKSRNII